VTIAGLANYKSVAEMAIGLIVALGRRITYAEREFRRGNFAVRLPFCGSDLEDKILGIAGLGKIGRRLAEKARLGLDMRILGYDPFVSKAQAPEGVEMVDTWEEIFTRSDFVSLHMPYTGEKLIGAREFGWMKPSAYFINLARGEIVVEEELIAALRSKQIAGAAIDVFEKEPPDPDNPLLAMDNVITLPHMAGLTEECSARMSLQAAQGIVEVLSGKRPSWPVNNPPSPRK
jgi:D-3-phosphoglycerate dehydrogenase